MRTERWYVTSFLNPRTAYEYIHLAGKRASTRLYNHSKRTISSLIAPTKDQTPPQHNADK